MREERESPAATESAQATDTAKEMSAEATESTSPSAESGVAALAGAASSVAATWHDESETTPSAVDIDAARRLVAIDSKNDAPECFVWVSL